MKTKKLLLILFLLSGVVVSSCKKDDKDNTVTDDPRIRTMSINSLSTTFVVNDVEGLIFNYDSLSYGTSVKTLRPIFTGYGGLLSFEYKLGGNGVWKEFTNDTLDFSSLPVFFKAKAPDPKYTKEYRIDVRVHKYDVEAFTWEESGTLPIQGTAVSQKAVFYNQKYYFFYCNDLGKSYVVTSTDGDNWTEAGEIGIDKLDWTTLTSMHQPQTLVVQAEGELYKCDDLSTNPSVFTPSNVELPEGCTLRVPLFTLENNFWIIASQADSTFLYSLANGAEEYQKGVLLPSRTPVEKITTFVSPSGSTTLGYIFGGEGTNGNGTVWGIDVNGNIVELTPGQSAFPFQAYPMPLFFGNNLCLVGEEVTSGNYTNRFYVSPNLGATWSKDTHKTLPDEISPIAKGSIFQYERNKIILIGGENKKGFSPTVWKGTLNQEILDDIIHNRN